MNKKRKSFIYGEITTKKSLTSEQLRIMFKRVYGKDPNTNEFQQFKLYHQGIL